MVYFCFQKVFLVLLKDLWLLKLIELCEKKYVVLGSKVNLGLVFVFSRIRAEDG